MTATGIFFVKPTFGIHFSFYADLVDIFSTYLGFSFWTLQKLNEAKSEVVAALIHLIRDEIFFYLEIFLYIRRTFVDTSCAKLVLRTVY